LNLNQLEKPLLFTASFFKSIAFIKRETLLFIIILFVFTSCKKNHSDPKPNTDTTANHTQTPPDIYVAGYVYNTSGQAAYWKNGVAQQVDPIGTTSNANAIAVQGNDVYLAGNAIVNGVMKAVYWKNGIPTVLDNGAAYGIAVQGSDVYVVGCNNLGTGIYVYDAATCWKNGVAMMLQNIAEENPGGPIGSLAMAIAVQGSDVHIVGYGDVSWGGGDPVALYWKNGVATELVKYYPADGLFNAQSHAYAIALQGADVFIAGGSTKNTDLSPPPNNYSGPMYWKDNVVNPFNITGESAPFSANSIAVNGSNVYVLAAGPTSKPVYWNNSAVVTLKTAFSATDGSTISINPTGIAVNNSDVYVSGYSQIFNAQGKATSNVQAFYWKNDQVVNLPGQVGQANAIVVVPHQ